MKRITAIFAMFLTTMSVCAKSNVFECFGKKCKADTIPASKLIAFLQQMDIESFYWKPVDSFLLAVPASFYNMKVFGGSHSQGALFRANYLSVDFRNYTNCPGVNIYVREFTHMNRYSPTATWDVNLFRREKIYKIEVYKDQNTCINGACMQ